MRKCTIYHTGVGISTDGVIKDHKVYLQGEENTLYFPEEMFMAREECEGGLIQFEVEGKWGFADIYTGQIAIDAVWDYAGPFYKGYAHVALGVLLEIHHGYIDQEGEIIIPLEYDDATDIPPINHRYFKVSRNKKWGLVDVQNEIMIPFQWDRLEINYRNDLIFCCKKEECEPTCYQTLKWGVYDKAFNLIVQPELDEEPIRPMMKPTPRSTTYGYYEKYYILKKGKKHGVLSQDGRWIANIELSKNQAKNMINYICERRFSGDLYI